MSDASQRASAMGFAGRVMCAALMLALAHAQQRDSVSSTPDRLEFLMVSFPFSPLHGVVAIGQELCLRGHNVTVLSFGERGGSKTKKYSPKCPLKYVSLGPLPVSEEAEEAILAEMALTNSTLKQIRTSAGGIFSAYISSVREPLTQILESGIVKPHFALVTFPMGVVGQILQDHGVDFAVNMPTAVLPPIIPWAAPYIPIPFYHVSVYGMTLLDRLIVVGGSHVFQLAMHIAAAAGSKFYYIPDLNPALWRGRLVLVNNVPGLDYPQPLPPLVQYTGPVTDLAKMEKFPSEVETWLKTVPKGSPVVYVSFGSVAYLARERVQAMVATLTSAQYHVLWALPKSQQEGLPASMPSSILVHHWIPTPRALAHPKVVAFISHCGGNSVSESMAMGVPIIGYPQFSDQPAVCQRVADAGAGVVGAKGGWVQAKDVLEVVTDPAYTKRAQSIARLFKGFGGVSKAGD